MEGNTSVDNQRRERENCHKRGFIDYLILEMNKV